MELRELLKELDQAQAELKRAVDNNSGYVGSDEWVNKCVEKINELIYELRNNYPDEYEEYLDRDYS